MFPEPEGDEGTEEDGQARAKEMMEERKEENMPVKEGVGKLWQGPVKKRGGQLASNNDTVEERVRREACGATAFGKLSNEIQKAIIDVGVRGSREAMDRRTQENIEALSDVGRFSFADKTPEEMDIL